MAVSQFRRQDNLFIARLLPRIADILHQAAMKKYRVLGYVSNVPVQAALRDLADILAINQNLAALNVVEPHQQFEERRFSAARRYH